MKAFGHNEKESTNVKPMPESKKGKHPKIAILNQDKVVKRKACCRLSFLFSSRLESISSIPINTVIEADDRKVLLVSSYIN